MRVCSSLLLTALPIFSARAASASASCFSTSAEMVILAASSAAAGLASCSRTPCSRFSAPWEGRGW